MSNSVNNPFPIRTSKRKLYLSLLACFLLVAAVAVTVSSVASRKNDSKSNSVHDNYHEAHGVIKSSCSFTLYPDLCVSALTSAPGDATSKVKTIRDVIELSLNLTTTAVQHNYFKIKKIIAKRSGLTAREKTALHDCLELVDETLQELRKSKEDLQDYLKLNKSVSEHAEDLKTLLSGAMTNQETCLDGFSHDKADKKVRAALLAGQIHVFHMVSNALAMVKNMTDADMATRGESSIDKSYVTSRHLSEKEEDDSIHWPEWLSAGDRRLLQATTLTPDVTVAADGTGNYRTVAAAVAAAPTGSSSRYIIKIKAGVYRENVEVPKNKINLMFIGDGRTNTIITGSRNVVDGSTTFNSATVAVVGDRFLARDVTFQNTAGPSKHQAVALRVGADFSAFYRCDMLAYQDTLYVHSLRQFYVQCIIAGTIDFIFGNAATVLQDCDIHARRPNTGQRNMLTAQGRDDPNQNTGIVIQKCRIGATSDLLAVAGSVESYLGRPWKEYSRTVIMQTSISDIIHPAGWYPWDGNFALDTLYYGEYQNTGPGAATASRVTWKGFRVITSATEAQAFTASQFIAGGSWLASTGFPFSLGL